MWGGAKLLAAEIAAEAHKLTRIEAAKYNTSVYQGGGGLANNRLQRLRLKQWYTKTK